VIFLSRNAGVVALLALLKITRCREICASAFEEFFIRADIEDMDTYGFTYFAGFHVADPPDERYVIVADPINK